MAVRFELVPERSEVWIDGSSTVHPIRARASGVEGWVSLATTKAGIAARPSVRGEVRIAVERLGSGNPLVDAETRRRIDARRFPEISGTVTGGRRVAEDRLALEGDISFRGRVEPVAGEVQVTFDGDAVVVEGEQTLDVRTWGLTPPRIGLLRVHPEITVRLRAEGVRTPSA